MSVETFDMVSTPVRTCVVCDTVLRLKMDIDNDANEMKWYHICDTCKTSTSETLSLVCSDDDEEYIGE